MKSQFCTLSMLLAVLLLVIACTKETPKKSTQSKRGKERVAPSKFAEEVALKLGDVYEITEVGPTEPGVRAYDIKVKRKGSNVITNLALAIKRTETGWVVIEQSTY